MLNSTYTPQRWIDIEASKVQESSLGMNGTASANTTTNIDKKITDDSFISNIQVIIQNMNFGDSIDVYVVDVNGIYAPSGTVSSHPIQSFFVQTSQQQQHDFNFSYPFKILGGTYIRVAYKNTNGLVAAQLDANLDLLTVLV